MNAGDSSEVIFVEWLSVNNWRQVILPELMKRRVKRLHVFDVATGQWPALNTLATAQGIQLVQLDFKIVDLRDELGQSLQFRLLYEDLAQLRASLETSSHVKEFLAHYPSDDRLSLFLAKGAVCDYDFNGPAKFNQLWHVLTLIAVVRWHLSSWQQDNVAARLFINNRPWFDELSRYAQAQQVTLHLSGAFQSRKSPLLKIKQLLPKLKNFRACQKVVLHYLKKIWILPSTPSPVVSPPRLATEYWGYLNLDRPECNSDLLFLQGSRLRGEEVTLLFNSMLDPLDESKWRVLHRHGLSAIALTPQANLLSATEAVTFTPQTANLPVLKLDKSTHESVYLWEQTQAYYRLKNYWKQLFRENNIKLTTSWYKYDAQHMVMADALKEVGGVATLYQRAYESNPSAGTAVSTDIVFGFSRRSAEVEKAGGSRFNYYVVVGYVGDYRFAPLKDLCAGLRQRLRQAGAKKIVAFFDENSLDDSRWFTGHEFTQENYEFVLDAVLRDSTLGLIIKPKTPRNLIQRLGRVSQKLLEAEATGRCYVFREGALQGAYSPAAAALAADLAIHESLGAGTAGLESALSGVPTFLLDREGWVKSPLYQLGIGKSVFLTWEELWNNVERFFHDPQERKILGNWSTFLPELDPYRDGQAAQRMGNFLQHLLHELKNGQTREVAIQTVAESFARQWGEDKIIRGALDV